MKVLFDHQIFTQQNYGGISLYFCELMNQFSKDPSVNLSIALKYTYNENLLRMPQLNKYWSNKSDFFSNNQLLSIIKNMSNRNILNFSLNNKFIHINQHESERSLKHQDFDIFHPTYYNPYFLKYLQKKPFVLTVYDMIHNLFPLYFPSNDPIIEWKKKLIENASSIVAISECTKRDIIKFYHVDPDMIHVIYLANTFENENAVSNENRPTSISKETYLLYIGNRNGYKNFIFMIQSIAPLLQKNSELHLCCAGGGVFTSHENKVLKNLKISHKVHYIKSDASKIKNLYKDACAFIFPSLYEGFGLPVLEAFSCGCPVLLSNKSSLKEIGGDATVSFDPGNSTSLFDAVERLLYDHKLRMQLIDKGYERLKLFSWRKTTEQTKTIYENIMNENPHN